MNLSKLFEAQKKLDDRIVKEKGLKGQDLLNKKILALLVEFGELANEYRGFKFWSKDQEPRTEHVCVLCDGNRQIERFIASWDPSDGYDQIEVEVDCPLCEGYDSDKNPLLEEYVDCLHFILSIGLEIGIKQDIFPEPIKYYDAVTQFNELFGQITYLANVLSWDDDWVEIVLNRDNDWEEVEFEYERVWSLFFGLGEILGFTWDEIEQAYFDKNKVNHERQENGY